MAIELGRTIFGSLAPGRLADLVVVDGDPLVNLQALRKVSLVVQQGRVVANRLVQGRQLESGPSPDLLPSWMTRMDV